MKTFESCKKQNGSVIVGDKELVLTNEPEICRNFNFDDYYQMMVNGRDIEGNRYKITCELNEGWEDMEDMEQVCCWLDCEAKFDYADEWEE